MTTTTTTVTAAPKVICTECRHDNEPERIYCHNCGERLDRSGVRTQKKSDSAEEARRRLAKMLGPPNQLRRNFFATSKLVLAAAATAVLVEIALPPDVPAPTKTAPQQIDLELEKLASSQQSVAPITYSQDQVNAYLTYRLAGKKKALNKPFLTFERAVASLREGEGTIAMERSLFGYSLFSRISYRVDAKDGKISATNTGGWIGRLPIHPALMNYGNIIFADLWSALDREHKLLAKMAAVTLQDGTVTVTGPAR